MLSSWLVNRRQPCTYLSFCSLARRKYFIIDFGLSRQHLGEDKKVIPARAMAEFRGTSMYASLSSHRRQELGPKDDLWSWFYLVMDFMRGELPWAADAQKKNRQTVLNLKEYYTEKCPSLLVEGLVGASHLVAIMKYLQSLKYEDTPDYDLLRKKLKRIETGSKEEDTMELWTAIESERERALQWAMRGKDAVVKNTAVAVLETLLAVARKFNTFFGVGDLTAEERVEVQEVVYLIEKKIREASQLFAPPPIESFVKRRQSEQKGRSDALRRRRERDVQIRQLLEQKARRQNGILTAPATTTTTPAGGVQNSNGTTASTTEVGGKIVDHKSEDSAMEMSDGEETATPPQMGKTLLLPSEEPVVRSSSNSMVFQKPPAPPGPPPQQRWATGPAANRPPFTSSPRPPPPLPPGPRNNGNYHGQQPPLPLPPGYHHHHPAGAGGVAFTPPLPPQPPLPPPQTAPVYSNNSPSGNGNGWPQAKPELERRPSTDSYDRNGDSHHDRRERDYEQDYESSKSHRERSRHGRRSPSRERKHRSSRKRSASRSSSRSRSPSRSRTPSRSSSRSHSPVHSKKSRSSHRSHRHRHRHRRRSSRSRSSSESRSRSPRRESSNSHHHSSHRSSHHSHSSNKRRSDEDKHHHRQRSYSRERHHHRDQPAQQQPQSKLRDDGGAPRRQSRWQPK